MKPTLQAICQVLEAFAPLGLQEEFDNCGLLVGSDPALPISGAVLCVDVTEAVVDEAISLGYNLIIAHHPVIFRGIKSLTGRNRVERCIIKAIENHVAIYAAHTNFDNAKDGVSYRMAQKLHLTDINVLVPKEKALCKLITFVPEAYADKVKNALFATGAGHIGAYDSCSFSHAGKGTFRANAGANPFCGAVGEVHTEAELRIEVIFPRYLQSTIVKTLFAEHPYEEPAFDLIDLSNTWRHTGLGVVGELPQAVNEHRFLSQLKETFACASIRHSPLTGRDIRRVALCGGSGAEFIPQALKANADIFVTADVSYHRFFETENRMIIADIGHYESEQFTREIFYEQLQKKIPNFAIRFSEREQRQMMTF
ncbi:MAG: Nif3-like dinuclear metal center hexameric protein [Prevotellaceae bacterium]|jgi:dinuclear metal center YbgI/SA1388 family protein|nr:Nif3-like dinuclear metal center hexameric protein [Prevotellaceae bacterium]